MPTKIFVTELVNAFNLNNYFSDNIYTNFTVQDGAKGKNDKIVSSFGRDGDIKKYLKEVREEIIRQHYSNEEAAGGFYNLNCFPFVFDVGFNKKGKFINKNVKVVELANLMDSEVIRNLKLHFTNEFQESVEAGVTGELKMMGMTRDEALKCVRKSVQLERVDKLSPYLYCISFGDVYFKEIGHPNPSRFLELFRNMYVAKFNLRLERCGLNDSSIFYEQRDNKLYIKDITDINVIKDIVRYVKERVALDFKTSGDVDSKVENCKDAINDLIFTVTGKFIEGYEYDVFTNKDKIKSGHSFALIPLVEVNGQVVPLSEEDAYKVKKKFYEILGDVVFSNIKGETKDELGQISSSQGPVYAFSNKQIALLLPMIMQSPIAYNQINGRFEFAVDLENFKRRGSSRSSSTVNSPLNSPTHAEPPTPSGDPGPSTELSYMEWESPTQSQGEELGRSPRRGLEKFPVLVRENPLDVPGTSREFPPRSHLSSPVTNPHSSKCVGAAQTVPAGTSAWGSYSSPPPLIPISGDSVSGSRLPVARPSSWKGANESGSASTSARGSYSSPPPLIPSRGSVSGSRLPVSFTSTRGPGSSPPPLIPSSGGIVPRFRPPTQVSSSEPSSSKGASERRTSDKPLTEEEKELFKALLYTLNLTNYTFGGVYTNFFAKGEKIVSLLHDNVDREKYSQAVKASIIKKYCETEEKARELCDLDEFPFKLNYEEKQGKTVVANISSGALSNLKILFSREFGKNVDAIDISAVKKVEKREKDEWVDRQLSKGCSLKGACISCFPDEGVMKQISITFDKEDDKYLPNRNCDICEVRLLWKEQSLRLAKDTSVAGKTKPEDNKDSGYSSGFVTDAGKVSSKAEEKTSDYYSMSEHTDHEESSPMQQQNSSQNTRGGSPKHKSPSPEDGGSPRKSPKRDSSPLSMLKSLSLSNSSHQTGKY